MSGRKSSILQLAITPAIKKPKSPPHPPFRKRGMGGFGKFMHLNSVVIKYKVFELDGYGCYAGEGINVHSGKKMEQNRESIFPGTERKILHTPTGFMRSFNLETLILPQRKT